MRAFSAFWATCRDLFDELLLLAVCNLLWVVMSGPLLFLAFLTLNGGAIVFSVAFALLAVLPMGPASAGLAVVALRVTEGRASSWRDFFGGVRRHARSSWIIMGIWMAVLMLIIVDLIFYVSMPNTFGFMMMVFWLIVLLLWFGALIYLFPLLILQDEPKLRLLARNTFLLTMGRPLFTFLTLVMMTVIAALSIFVPILPLFLTFGFFAQWSMRATLELVKESEARRAALEEAELLKNGPPKRIPPWRSQQ